MANDQPIGLAKFSKDFLCPKCSSDKCGTRLDEQPERPQDAERRRRLGWPLQGELMVQSCQICGHVKVSRPLDFQPEEHK